MVKKNLTTQELANAYPDWSRVRSDDQSTGKALLNTLAANLDSIVTELYRGYDNLYLSTANVSEIDLVYAYPLPSRYEIPVDSTVHIEPNPVLPTVSGRVGNDWFEVEEVLTGSIKDFWYEALPTRISLNSTFSGITYSLVDGTSDEYSWSLDTELDIENKLNITVVSGLYLWQEEKDSIQRSKIRITGTTWKDTEEVEELVFLYNKTKQTAKTWKEIEKIEAVDFPVSANVTVTSFRFNQAYYDDPYRDLQQFEDSRDNLPLFWRVEDGLASGVSTLSASAYTGLVVSDLLRNVTDIKTLRQWEFIDEGSSPIEVLDIAPIPYSRRCWAVTATGLHLYSLDFDMPDVSSLNRDANSLIRIEVTNDYPIREEEVGIDLLLKRPIKTLVSHRVTLTYPDGESWGIDEDGSLVTTSGNYWVEGILHDRFIRPTFFLSLEEYGEHILTLDALYSDGTSETEERIITVESKQPLVSFDLTELGLSGITAVDIDHLHNLTLLDSSGDAHRINLHHDVMLVDYSQRELLFRENYDEIKIPL